MWRYFKLSGLVCYFETLLAEQSALETRNINLLHTQLSWLNQTGRVKITTAAVHCPVGVKCASSLDYQQLDKTTRFREDSVHIYRWKAPGSTAHQRPSSF
jgi:hypothetical protein